MTAHTFPSSAAHGCPLRGRIVVDHDLRRYRVTGCGQAKAASFWHLVRLDENGSEVPDALVQVRIPARGWPLPGFTLQNANALAG